MWLFGKSKLPGSVCVIEGLTISADEVRKEYLTNIYHLCFENGELRGQPVLDDPPGHTLCLFWRGVNFGTVPPRRVSFLALQNHAYTLSVTREPNCSLSIRCDDGEADCQNPAVVIVVEHDLPGAMVGQRLMDVAHGLGDRNGRGIVFQSGYLTPPPQLPPNKR